MEPRSMSIRQGLVILMGTFCGLSSGCQYLTYAGINLGPGMAPPPIQRLAHKAEQGDRQARYQLGVLYEGGQGLVRNVVCAARLYEAAASGPEGLPEAKARLEEIREAVEREPDPQEAAKWCVLSSW